MGKHGYKASSPKNLIHCLLPSCHFKSVLTDFLPWSTKGDILKIVYGALFHTMKAVCAKADKNPNYKSSYNFLMKSFSWYKGPCISNLDSI